MIDLLGSASTPLSHPQRFYPHAYHDDRIFTQRGQNVFSGGPYNSGIVDGARASTEPERGGCMGIKGGDHDQSQSAGAYGPRKMGIVAKDICMGMVQRGHRDRSQSAGRI